MILRNKTLVLAVICLMPAVYIGWNLIGSPVRAIQDAPPAASGMPPVEQLKKGREESTTLKVGTDQLVEAAFRFEPPGTNPSDPKPVATVRLILEGHYNDLIDLERFLKRGA